MLFKINTAKKYFYVQTNVKIFKNAKKISANTFLKFVTTLLSQYLKKKLSKNIFKTCDIFSKNNSFYNLL
jgi:hypothetical protein